MAEHKHGTMDITAHEKTFNGFVKLSTRVAITCIVALILITIFNG